MKSAIHDFCTGIGTQPPKHVQIGRRYFYDPEGLQEQGFDAFSLGVFLGEKKQRFFPSPALFDYVDLPAITVNEQAAWMFLCGKDVLMEGVAGGEASEGTHVKVMDEEGNTLGYGRVRNVFDAQKEHAVFVKNLLDRGAYLRRE